MPKPIDLGRKLNDMISISAMQPDEAHYPELCISDADEQLAEMPDEGTATIRYRVRNRTHREEKNGKRKERSCSLRLDVLSIEPPPSKKKKNGNSDGGVRKAMNDYFKDK
jgi:hypothetical protein